MVIKYPAAFGDAGNDVELEERAECLERLIRAKVPAGVVAVQAGELGGFFRRGFGKLR